MKKIKKYEDLKELAKNQKDLNNKYKKIVTICAGTGCSASGCTEVLNCLINEIKARKLEKEIKIRPTGCHGFCEQGPLLVIEPDNIFYCKVQPKDVQEIIETSLINNKILERLLYVDPTNLEIIKKEQEIPFYKGQERIILSQNKLMNPCDIYDYIANDGYQAFFKVLNSFSKEKVIEEIQNSELRGRGGGGFPTGDKWQSVKKEASDIKHVICNADEGDPGAYMDRSILEGNPHSVIEGMLIGAYAVGANQGYIYVRNEYPLAVKNSKIAIQQAQELGLLGNNVFGSDFSFNIKIARGGGAFVCGESTALMSSLEGKVGEPRAKDIHTSEKGLYDLPTVLNNVETWANIPLIINNGYKWFAKKGTEKSKGTKIFALTGHIKNTGLVEVPMGTTINKIIYDIGGGPLEGKKIKAVQTGGPSGGCLPEKMFDLTVDFEELMQAGSMVGSGGMVVMDEATCMVDVAKYFLTFLLDESCGKCSTCRIGIERMLEIVTDITEGKGTKEKLELLIETAETVSQASLCGLGKTAANPVLSTIKYFLSEYETHINEKKCPAKVCKSLISFSIDQDLCKSCNACFKACPYQVISVTDKKYTIDSDKCTKCGICFDTCKFNAVIIN